MMEPDWLQDRLLDFARVVRGCLRDTTYSEDRSVFQGDLATVAGWLVDIYEGRSREAIVDEVLSENSSKYFHDYWRRGIWGDRESQAFEALRTALLERRAESS